MKPFVVVPQDLDEGLVTPGLEDPHFETPVALVGLGPGVQGTLGVVQTHGPWIEAKLETEVVQPEPELDVFAAQEIRVETAHGHEVPPPERRVPRPELTERGREVPARHRVVLLLDLGLLPGDPRLRIVRQGRERADHDELDALARVSAEVLLDELRHRLHVVVQEQDEVAPRRFDPRVSSACRAAVALPERTNRERLTNVGERVRGAVTRAVVDDHDLEAARIDGLPRERGQDAEEPLPAVVGRYHDAELETHLSTVHGYHSSRCCQDPGALPRPRAPRGKARTSGRARASIGLEGSHPGRLPCHGGRRSIVSDETR